MYLALNFFVEYQLYFSTCLKEYFRLFVCLVMNKPVQTQIDRNSHFFLDHIICTCYSEIFSPNLQSCASVKVKYTFRT